MPSIALHAAANFRTSDTTNLASRANKTDNKVWKSTTHVIAIVVWLNQFGCPLYGNCKAHVRLWTETCGAACATLCQGYVTQPCPVDWWYHSWQTCRTHMTLVAPMCNPSAILLKLHKSLFQTTNYMSLLLFVASYPHVCCLVDAMLRAGACVHYSTRNIWCCHNAYSCVCGLLKSTSSGRVGVCALLSIDLQNNEVCFRWWW